jgi:hypothetical protein
MSLCKCDICICQISIFRPSRAKEIHSTDRVARARRTYPGGASAGPPVMAAFLPWFSVADVAVNYLLTRKISPYYTPTLKEEVDA